MSRDITSAAAAAAAAAHVRLLALVEFDFAGGAVRLASTPYDVTWDSKVWSGVGVLGKISPVEEAAEQRQYSLSFSLSGIDTSLISTALNEDYQGRSAIAWLAFLDADNQIIADPVIAFSGLMDTMDITAGKTAEIQVVATDRRATWEKPASLRYNDATQQSLFPGDRGLEFVEQMVEKQIVWG